MDGQVIFTRTNELRREGNTEDTGRWCNRVFFTHVKAGGGTKKWLICYMVGNAGIWIL